MKIKRIVIAIVCILFGIVMFLKSGNERVAINGEFVRGLPNESPEHMTVEAQISDETVSDIDIEIPVRDYSYEEFMEMAEKSAGDIIGKMLCDNKNTENIESDIMFFSEYEEFPFEINWSVSDIGLIDDEGKLLTDKPFNAIINLQLSYESYTKDYSIPVHANPGSEVSKRLLRARLEEKIKEALQDREKNAMISDDNLIRLPDNVDGENVDYYTQGTPRNPGYLLLGLFMAVIVDIAFVADRKKEGEIKKEALLREYPGLVRKICIYLPTGMTLRNIWVKIFENECQRGIEEQALCREIGILVNELRNGIAENEAYSDFSKRIGIPQYLKLSALLTQNLKKGSTKLGQLLSEEAKSAYGEKKNRARRKGEEAGTGLLIPMMILLVDVMLLIMIPAFKTV